MPRRLEGTPRPYISATKDAYIFVGDSGKGKAGYWYLRVNLPDRQQFVRSTKIPFEETEENQIRAIQSARSIYEGVQDRLALELGVKAPNILLLLTELEEEAEHGAEVNSKLDIPTARIEDGSGYWTRQQLSQVKSAARDVIRPFFGSKKYKDKEINRITQRDVDDWAKWRAQEYPEKWAPSTLNKQNIVLRSLFKRALRNGERFVPPIIKDHKRELRKRRRPEVADDQYLEMLQHIRSKFGEVITLKEQYAYLFYCWLETLEHTGIRPFNSVKNAIKLDDIERGMDSEGREILLLRREEKGHTYTAAASRYWGKTLDRLDKFYQAQGINKNREYLFVHPKNSTLGGRQILKGSPIASFRSQWVTTMKDLGFNDGVTQKHKKLSPYSIRHRYAGRRLRQDADITPIELAEIMGTSLQMISDIYHHYQVEKNYQKLMQGTLDEQERIDRFNTNGIWLGTAIRNSEDHIKAFQRGETVIKPRIRLTASN